MASDFAKVSVSLPSPLVERIKQKVGARGVSRYVAHALEQEERREALRGWLTDQDRQHGRAAFRRGTGFRQHRHEVIFRPNHYTLNIPEIS